MTCRTSMDSVFTRGRVLEDPRSIGAPARPPSAAAAPAVVHAKTAGVAAPAFAELSAARAAETKEKASTRSAMASKAPPAANGTSAPVRSNSADAAEALSVLRKMLSEEWDTYFLPTITPLSYGEICHLTVKQVVNVCCMNVMGILLRSRKMQIDALIKWFKWDELIHIHGPVVKASLLKRIQMILKKPTEPGYPDNELLMKSIHHCIELFCLLKTPKYDGCWELLIDKDARMMASGIVKRQKLCAELEVEWADYRRISFVQLATQYEAMLGSYSSLLNFLNANKKGIDIQLTQLEALEIHVSQHRTLIENYETIRTLSHVSVQYIHKITDVIKQGKPTAKHHYTLQSFGHLADEITKRFFITRNDYKKVEQFWFGTEVSAGSSVDLMLNNVVSGMYAYIFDFFNQLIEDPTLNRLAYPSCEIFDPNVKDKISGFCSVIKVLLKEIIKQFDAYIDKIERVLESERPKCDAVIPELDGVNYEIYCAKAEIAFNKFIAAHQSSPHELKYLQYLKKAIFEAGKGLRKRLFQLSLDISQDLCITEHNRIVLSISHVRIGMESVHTLLCGAEVSDAGFSFTASFQTFLRHFSFFLGEKESRLRFSNDFRTSLQLNGKQQGLDGKIPPNLAAYLIKESDIQRIEQHLKMFSLLNHHYSDFLSLITMPNGSFETLITAAYAATLKSNVMADRICDQSNRDTINLVPSQDVSISEGETKAKASIETLRPQKFPKTKTTPKRGKKATPSAGEALTPAELIISISKKIFLLFRIDSLQQLTQLRGNVNLHLADSLFALNHLKRVVLNTLKTNQPEVNQEQYNTVKLVGAVVLERMLGYLILDKRPQANLSHNLRVQMKRAGVDLLRTVWTTPLFRKVIVLSRYLYVYHKNRLKEEEDFKVSQERILRVYAELISNLTKSLAFYYPDVCSSLDQINKQNTLLLARIRMLPIAKEPPAIAKSTGTPILIAPDFFHPHAFKVEAALNQAMSLTAAIEAERKLARSKSKQVVDGDAAQRKVIDEGVQLRLTRGRLKSIELLLLERQLSLHLSFALASGPENWHQFFHSLLYSTHFIVENSAVIFGNKCRKTIPDHNMMFVLKAGFGSGLDADERATLQLVTELRNAELFPMQYAEKFRNAKKPIPQLFELTLNLQFYAEHLAKGVVGTSFVGYGNNPISIDQLRSQFTKYSIDLINLTHAMMMKELPRILALKPV